jgi:hypothetical protein
MKMLAITMAAAAVLSAAPLATAKADPIRMAQVGVDIELGPGRHRGPGIVVAPAPGIVVETEGRGRRDCRSVTVTEWQNGVRVSRTERRCD